MKRRLLMATAATGVAAASAVAAYMSGGVQREDCPGKIICPITGDLICADECPAESAKTVELPVADVPACCAGKN